MNLSVVTLGDLVADLIVPISHLPIRAHEHQPARDLVLEAGGIGNFLVTAARLGLRPTALGTVGKDYYGEQVLDILGSEGVNIDNIVTPPRSRTTTSIVLVDDDTDHVFVWMRGSGPSISWHYNWKTIIEGAGAVFTGGYAIDAAAPFAPEVMMTCLKLAHQHNIPIFFDLGPAAFIANRALIKQAIGYATVLLTTQEEAVEWLGLSDPLAAAHQFLEQGLSTVIIKLGPDGCLLVTREEHVQVKAFTVTVRDTAGAGDAFASGCVYGFLQKFSLGHIGQLANAIGSISVSKLGTGTHLARDDEIKKLLLSCEHPITHSTVPGNATTPSSARMNGTTNCG